VFSSFQLPQFSATAPRSHFPQASSLAVQSSSLPQRPAQPARERPGSGGSTLRRDATPQHCRARRSASWRGQTVRRLGRARTVRVKRPGVGYPDGACSPSFPWRAFLARPLSWNQPCRRAGRASVAARPGRSRLFASGACARALRLAPKSLRSGPQSTCSTSGAAPCHPPPERRRGNACVRRTCCRAEATAAQQARSAEYTNGSELCWWLGGPRERRASRPGAGATDCASIFCAIWLPPPPLCAHVTCRPATGSGGSRCRRPTPVHNPSAQCRRTLARRSSVVYVRAHAERVFRREGTAWGVQDAPGGALTRSPVQHRARGPWIL
jgi:hypothetical protein